jgi:hypothetical protein
MSDNTTERAPVSTSRRINAPADAVFAILANPANHGRIDGSGMLREPKAGAVISKVGDTFVFAMHNDEMGDYEMTNHVVVFEPSRAIAWEPVLSGATRTEDIAEIGDRAHHRWGYELHADGPGTTVVTEVFDCSASPDWLKKALDGGKRWLPVMGSSLERLEEIATS